MSKWQLDGIGESFEIAPNVHIMVYHLDAKGRVVWQITACDGDGDIVHLVENEDEHVTEEDAEIAGLEAAAELGKRIEATATAELRRIKQAARDADDAALVAAHGEVVWSLTAPTRPDGPTYRRAQVAGHPVVVEEFASGRVKWWVEPDYYGHEYTWDAPDVATAMQRATATALRDPCRRWMVEIPDQTLGQREIKGGTVEVWAVTSEGALYRACDALEIRSFGRAVYGKAMEVSK